MLFLMMWAKAIDAVFYGITDATSTKKYKTGKGLHRPGLSDVIKAYKRDHDEDREER